jgi:hypothetical protein
MTISTYPINAGVEAYSRQSKVRLKAEVSAEGANRDKFVDVVNLSWKNEVKIETPAKNAYTREDLLPPKKSEVG